MIICGIKLTHDGGLALIDNNRLVFSYEMEKLDNNGRYSTLEDTVQLKQILASYGYSIDQVDRFVIDGWDGLESSSLRYQSQSEDHEVAVAPYREQKLSDSILERFTGEGFTIGDRQVSYSSYFHVTGHVLGAYASSPFAQEKKGSYVLVWDGGMFPRLYYVDPKAGTIANYGKLFFLIGNIYSLFPLHFEPFRQERNKKNVHLSVAGKVMAYIAHGEAREDIIADLQIAYDSQEEYTIDSGDRIARSFIKATRQKNYRHEDILASFHAFVERLLIQHLGEKVEKYGHEDNNLCFAGGCALNIKWNSAIRRSGHFADLWVPPFP
ncbi:MAG TPA: hypothetical protein DCR93_26475, partial [Cytophagales bacterium]|nr:hypothetical protein [Cytophagales bacterium]